MAQDKLTYDERRRVEGIRDNQLRQQAGGRDTDWDEATFFLDIIDRLAPGNSGRARKSLEDQRGVVPIAFLVILTLASGLFAGAKFAEHRINQTMICHEPGKEALPWCRNCRQRTEYPEAPMRWPSMSVPDYDGGGR